MSVKKIPSYLNSSLDGSTNPRRKKMTDTVVLIAETRALGQVLPPIGLVSRYV